MNVQPQISVVIPNYNYAVYLPECIESVINQTFENWELIIVDDNSLDDSVGIVNKYIKEYPDLNIKLLVNKKGPSGTSCPLNIGIKNAKGKYIAWLSSDDYFEPEKLAMQYDIMSAHPEIDICSTYPNFVDGNSKLIQKFKLDYEPEHIFNNLLNLNCVNGSSILIKKELIEKYGYFIDDDELFGNDMWRINDYHMWLTLAINNHKYYLICEYLHNTRIHEVNQQYRSFKIPFVLMKVAVEKVIKENLYNFVPENCLKELEENNYSKQLGFYIDNKDKGWGKKLSDIPEYNKKIYLFYLMELFKFHIKNNRFDIATDYLNSIKKIFSGKVDFFKYIYYICKNKNLDNKYYDAFKNKEDFIYSDIVIKIESLIKNKNSIDDYRFLDYLSIKEKYINIIDYCYEYASLYKKSNMLDIAEKYFKRVLEINTDKSDIFHAGACFHIGEINYLRNKFSIAKEYFEKCISYNPGFRKSKLYLEELK